MESGHRGYMEAPSISPPGRVPNRHLASPDSAIGFPAWRPVRYLIGSGVQGCCHFRKPDWSRSDCGRAGRITAPWGRAIHVDGRYGVRGTCTEYIQRNPTWRPTFKYWPSFKPATRGGADSTQTSWQTLGTDLDLDLNLDHLPSTLPPQCHVLYVHPHPRLAVLLPALLTPRQENLSCVLYGPGKVRFEERPLPVVEDAHDVVVRIAYVGVCGTDVCEPRHPPPT